MLKIRGITNKGGGSVPSMPAPVPAPPPPTVDNSEEVKKQRLLEEERNKRSKGLGATDLTEGEVLLDEENIEKKKAEDGSAKTLLGS